jgi:hypothetical protein
MADGGLIESIPFESAFAEGATHVRVSVLAPARVPTVPIPATADRIRASERSARARGVDELPPGRYNHPAPHLETNATVTRRCCRSRLRWECAVHFLERSPTAVRLVRRSAPRRA